MGANYWGCEKRDRDNWDWGNSFTKASYTSSSIIIQVSESVNTVYMATFVC